MQEMSSGVSPHMCQMLTPIKSNVLHMQGVRARTELERGQDVINSRLQIGFVGEDPYNLTVVIQGLEEGWTSFPYAWNFSGQADLDLKDGYGRNKELEEGGRRVCNNCGEVS